MKRKQHPAAANAAPEESPPQKQRRKRRRRKHSVLTFVILSFLISAVITFLCCWGVSFANKIVEITTESSDKARTVASIVNDFFNSNLLALSRSDTQDNGSYEKNPLLSEKRREVLSALCKNFGFKYLSVFGVDEETKEYLYLFVVASDPDLNAEVEEKRPFGTTVHVDPIPDSVIAACHGKTDSTLWKDDNEFGQTIGWAYPLMLDLDDDDIDDYLVLAAEFDTKKIELEILSSTLSVSLPIIGFLFVILMILLIIIRKRILRPIAVISDKMNSFAEGEAIPNERLNIKKNDEIGEIASSFNKMTEDIRDYISSINDLTTYRVQASTQMEIAERIQYGIVPEKTELHESNINACAIEKPARLIGGDFYDCFLRGGGHELCMVMGDVSGKGITAALFMVMVKTALREKLLSGMGPADALNVINDDICCSNPEGMFATIFAAVLDTGTGLLRYANAGHTPPVLICGQPELFHPDPGIAIGLFEDAGITEGALLLHTGTGIVLYTDGVTEAIDPEDHFFGEDRMLAALAGAKDAAGAVRKLRRSIVGFYGGREQFDDLTILAAFCENNRNRLLLKPDLDEQDRINELLQREAAESPRLRKIILACEELFTNIVSYSGADEIIFNCRKDKNILRVELLDNGKPFDPLKDPPAEKDFEDLDTGGMGIALVRQIAFKVSFRRMGNYNRLTMTLKLYD